MLRYSKRRRFSATDRQSFILNSFMIGLLVVSLTFVSYSRNVSVSHTQMSLHAALMQSCDGDSAASSDSELVSYCERSNTCSSPALVGGHMALPVAMDSYLFAGLSPHPTGWLSSPPFHPPKA